MVVPAMKIDTLFGTSKLKKGKLIGYYYYSKKLFNFAILNKLMN